MDSGYILSGAGAKRRLADDMGLGRTTQAIAACHGLLESGAIQRGLLIVPAALEHQWVREWRATSAVPLALVEGTPEARAAVYAATRRGFSIIGYEQLLRDLRPGSRRRMPSEARVRGVDRDLVR